MKKWFAYLFIVTLLVSFVLPSGNTTTAQSIADLERELKELEEERNSIDQDSSDAEQKLAENEAKQAEVSQEIDDINAELDVTEANLANKQNDITKTNEQIKTIETSIKETEIEIEQTEIEIIDLNDEIDILMARIADREELIKNRMRSIQHNGGDVTYLQVLMGAQSFGDFINRVTAVTRIIDQDNTIIERQQADKLSLEESVALVEEKQDQLTADKERLDNDKNELENQRATLVAQQQELANLQAQLNEQIDDRTNLMATLEDEYDELEEYQITLADLQEVQRSSVAALEKAIELARKEEEEKQRLAQLAQEPQNDQASNNAVLFWPASTRRVTSPYGYRTHPITGEPYRFHTGIDIAQIGYQEIYAAEAGIVQATYTENDGLMRGYGDTILITHYIDLNGDGNRQQISTLYAHLRSGTTLVRAGDQVQRGQKIATMGNTGNSTGQHLHFEVHTGHWRGRDSSLNPLNYLSP
ncbi:murein DD-endopeptidase MepM/ murein hydrolase activator NlpD [Natronobacillus azotifigens]|uniref:Peptidoglycan DD-metalloendopeptidase family protein n=1 Tax=Natronobacillus azotifigens TaxID=472978 RepID=A0A9J6RFD8_9BACI|nr:peptidoglycan DD-metalloendopeptidase family protein [Natronobacillus azotifigens]MCZ0704126.1 peptidoglycan DD-metalloendopeptidase family protein [Natronobacillus azotifigens]